MTEDRDFNELFKPARDRGATQPGKPVGGPTPVVEDAGSEAHTSPIDADFEPVTPPDGPAWTPRSVGVLAGGGCLVLVLIAVVVFAFVQVFSRRGGKEEKPTTTPTVAVVTTPVATPPSVAESPLAIPVVSSDEVRIPVALPARLVISDTVFTVEPVPAAANAWPPAPPAGDRVNWVNGTVVNYILGLAPTPENEHLLTALQAGQIIQLHMSTDLILDFSVVEVTAGTVDDSALFEQTSPRLTLGLLTEDPAQRVVVRATFFSDKVAQEGGMLDNAAVGLVNKPVEKGPVRVTIIEAYNAVGGLPPDMGYLLLDVRVENLGTEVLETGLFQTFITDATGNRYPLTLLAEQFTHYGLPTEPLAPGETVIGSMGYLVPRPRSSAEQLRWVFDPLPGSDNWVIVPVPYDLPPSQPTPEPTLAVGFAQVSLDPNDVFVDARNNLLDVSLLIENVSDGVVQVTADDVSLSSWTDGELTLIAAAPALPWTVAPAESRLFQLQFDLPSTDAALLTVLGYTYSIENIQP